MLFDGHWSASISYAIPTREALNAIATLGPILEVGAGTGYWAWLLEQCGVDILCYDAEPPGAPDAPNRFHGKNKVWTKVLQGDENVVTSWPDRTLMLCWPPPRDEMAFRAISLYRGDVLVFVGEVPQNAKRQGVTGSEAFLSKLMAEWLPVRVVELPQWEICQDNLYILWRRHVE